METYQQLMAKRRYLNEAAQFEEPGSNEYNKIINQIKEIDAQQLNTHTPIQKIIQR